MGQAFYTESSRQQEETCIAGCSYGKDKCRCKVNLRAFCGVQKLAISEIFPQWCRLTCSATSRHVTAILGQWPSQGEESPHLLPYTALPFQLQEWPLSLTSTQGGHLLVAGACPQPVCSPGSRQSCLQGRLCYGSCNTCVLVPMNPRLPEA